MSSILGWVGLSERVAAQSARNDERLRKDVFPARHGRSAAAFWSQEPARLTGTGRTSTAYYPHCCMAPALDGRVLNAQDLRSAAQRAGAGPARGSDGRALVVGHGLWGDSVAEQLHGELAFALWDGRGSGRLLLARDRFGQKPLYYRRDGEGGLWFASELKWLAAMNGVLEVDPDSLKHYLERGFVPEGQCILKGYGKLPPGHVLTWEAGSVADRRYWSPPDSADASPTPGRTAAGQALRECLEEAVRARLWGDDRVGVVLSGDIASAVIAACMSRDGARPLRTYTACLGPGGLHDNERARRTALWLGSTHRAIMLGPRVGRLLPFIASQLDEPISDPSIISAYLLFLHAREEAGALLTAQGFGGDPPERAFGRGAVPATDRLAAEAALEVRMPFLDESLAPWRLTEAHLREALDGRLPRHVLKPVRRSPASSVDDWLRCEWRALAQDILLDPATQQRGWTDGEETRRLLNEHIAGRARHGRRLYRLLLLELWARAMIGREQAEPAPADLGDCARELPSDRAVRKVAVIAPAGIGDTVRLTPALTQMAASDPCLSLTLYVDAGRGSDEVMAGLAPADRHVPIEFHGGALAKVRALVGDIRRNTPDELVSAWVSRLAGLTGLLSGVKRRRGWVPRWSWAMRLGGLAWPKAEPYDPPRKDAGAYDMRAFARLLGIPSLETLAPRFASPIWEDRGLKSARRRIASLERPILAVSAAAAPAVRQREYPLDLMAKALRAVLGDGTAGSVVLLGDAPSRPRLEPLAKATAPHSLNLCGEVRISGAAALIRQCDAALVVDGGLLHVALCSDLPVVALYGPTLIFSSDPRDALGRYEVVSAFDRCRCRCRPHRGILAREECHGQAECLAAVAPEEVACAIASALRSCTVSAARGNG